MPVDDSSPLPAAVRGCTRPLVVRCGAFGDMVLITALIRGLSLRFGSSVDLLTSGPWSEPLLRGQPGVGEILTLRSRKTPYWLSPDQQRAVRRLRARGPGPTWFCDAGEAVRPLLRRAGIGAEYLVDVRDHPLLPGEHATQQWARLAQAMPRAGALHPAATAAAGASGGCSLTVSAAQRADLATWLAARGLAARPFIALQVGNKRTMRRGLKRLAVNHKFWPQDRWVAVLRHLRARQPDHAILLLGTGREYRLNHTIGAAAAVAGLHNVADDLPVSRLVALLARAAGLITVDSGPAHAAAAVGCPEVVLFGKASPSLYRPWGTAGAAVRVLTGQVAGTASMLGIEVGSVTAAWDCLPLRAAGTR